MSKNRVAGIENKEENFRNERRGYDKCEDNPVECSFVDEKTLCEIVKGFTRSKTRRGKHVLYLY